MDNIFCQDPLELWINEREEPVLNGRDNEWLDEELLQPMDDDSEMQVESELPMQPRHSS